MIAKSDMPNINDKKPEGLKPEGTPYRVLIVDDSMFIAKQLGQILTSEGFDVIATAGDGLAGIEKYKELSPGIEIGSAQVWTPVTEYDLGRRLLLEKKNIRILMLRMI